MKPLHLSSPHIIALVGIPGAGKTQFAEEFAKTFNAPCLKSELFDSIISAKEAHELSLQLLDEFMKTKQTIVFDGALGKRMARTELVKNARANGYKVLFVWVQTDQPTAQARWTKLHRGDMGDFDEKMKHFSAPHESEPYVVISGRHTYVTQARTLLRRLSAPRAQAQQSQPLASRQIHAQSPRIRVE